jgi:lysophospholipase L1-like esterase
MAVKWSDFIAALPSGSPNTGDVVPFIDGGVAKRGPGYATKQALDAALIGGGGVPSGGGTGDVLAKQSASSLDLFWLDDQRAVQARNSVIVFGDSTALGTGSEVVQNVAGEPAFPQHFRSFMTWANMYLGQRLRWVRTGTFGGERTDQLLPRVDAEVLAHQSGWVLVTAGANDVAQDVAAATVIANLSAIFDKIRAAGRNVCALTIVPSTSYTSGRIAVLHQVNDWLRAYQHTTKGVVVVDAWKAMADPGTGFPNTAMVVDGVHQSQAGAWRVGRMIADALAPLIPNTPPQLTTPNHPRNAMAASGFSVNGSGWAWLNDSGTGTRSVSYTTASDSWSTQAAITLDSITHVERSLLTAPLEDTASGRWSPGDVVQASCRVRWNLSARVSGTDLVRPYLRLGLRKTTAAGGGFLFVHGVNGPSAEAVESGAAWPTTGDVVLLTNKATTASDTDRLYVACGMLGAATGTVTVSDLAVWRVT